MPWTHNLWVNDVNRISAFLRLCFSFSRGLKRVRPLLLVLRSVEFCAFLIFSNIIINWHIFWRVRVRKKNLLRSFLLQMFPCIIRIVKGQREAKSRMMGRNNLLSQFAQGAKRKATDLSIRYTRHSVFGVPLFYTLPGCPILHFFSWRTQSPFNKLRRFGSAIS
jgi:hypothetical protein